MKDTDFKIKSLNGEIYIHLPEFECMLDFDDNNVYVSEMTANPSLSYIDYENQLSPILHFIWHMYKLPHMAETVKQGLSSNTSIFRESYNDLLKMSANNKLDYLTIISEQND